MSDELTIDFGDGVSALARVMRSIVMAADGAIQALVGMGWRRGSVNLEIDPDDPLPCWVTLRGRRVFEVDHGVGPEHRIVVKGFWLRDVRPPGTLRRWFGRY